MNALDRHMLERARELAPDDVDAAVYALRHAAADLIELRHTDADRVMEEKKAIHAAFSALKGLVEDIEASA